VDADSPDQSLTLSLGEGQGRFDNSLAMVSGGATKEASLLSRRHVSPGVSFCLSRVSRKGQEWWTSSVQKWSLALGRAW